jgi:hypothetical protein
MIGKKYDLNKRTINLKQTDIKEAITSINQKLYHLT